MGDTQRDDTEEPITPCPEPDGGWTPVDAAGDASLYVLNVTTTGDVEAMETDLRTVWGGSLCVSPSDHTERELNRIASSLTDLPGVSSTSSDVVDGVATATVWVASEELWRRAGSEHGADVIRLEGLLEPID